MTSQIILLYLLKTILVSSIFVTYYWFALRNKKFHYYNRFYLLTASVISLIIPLLNFNWFSIEEPVLYGSSEVLQFVLPLKTATTTSSSSYQYSWMDYALVISFIVTMALVIILFIQILKVQILKKKSVVTPMDGFDFINTKEENAPFSFLNNLFWKETISLQDEGGQQIFKHEITHIQQRHTWDRIYCQIVASLFWMNPINWIIQKELMTIHEFIADEEAVGNENVEIFAKMLLQTHYGNHFLNPTHQFFYSSIKRRLIMLTLSTNTKYSYLRRVMVLPVLIASVCMVSIKVHAKEIIENKVESFKNNISLLVIDTIRPVNSNDTSLPKPPPPPPPLSNEGKPVYFINGVKMSETEMRSISPNDIESVKVWKGEQAIDKFAKDGQNGVIEITLKSTTSVKRIDVDAKYVSATPLYVVDGVPLKNANSIFIDTIRVTEIESMTIRKDPSVLSLYGQQAKNGVIFIATKQGAKTNLQDKMPSETVVGYGKKSKEEPTIFNAPKIQKLVDSKTNNEPIFYTAEKSPQFPGGSNGWVSYLSKNLNRDLPVSKGAPSGQYKVVLSFIVSNTGEVRNVEALNDPGYGTAAEAIRMIEKGPKWIPAEQNGNKVNYFVTQTIVFAIKND
jgi:TonB-dependent SusC/RagA subfamily outer membrane receptor